MFCRDAGMPPQSRFIVPSVGQVGSRVGSRGNERQWARIHRQAMRRTMNQAQRITRTGGLGSLTPGVCFRATRRSYPDALLVVSDILAEAEVRHEAGQIGAARRLDALAEQIALHSGFSELLHLVWAYSKGK